MKNALKVQSSKCEQKDGLKTLDYNFVNPKLTGFIINY